MTSSCHPLAQTGSPSVDIPLLLLTGLTMSLGHCVGMCGPLQAAFSMERTKASGSRRGLALSLARYHSGRLLSYILLGGAFALAGTATRIAGAAGAVQGTLAIVSGALMFGVALGIVGILPVQTWAEPGWMSDRLFRRFRGLVSGEGWGRQFSLGMANGFLPCGPVLAVALGAAAAAHVLVGMLLMLVYGLGTVPVLITLGMASSRLSPKLRLRFYRVGGVMVGLIAVQLVLRGASTFGWMPHWRVGDLVIW